MASTEGDLASCIAEHASRGPRYTSYPPATEFHELAAGIVEAELATVAAANTPISLYAHIPFCRSLCAYCGCNVIPTRDQTRADPYIDYMLTELALLQRAKITAPVVEIALGGGSPNFLQPRQLRQLLTGIETYFHVAKTARRSIELDPRSTTSNQLETLSDLGFTSLSMGVQDFAEPVQDAIRRHQSVVQTRWLVDHARAVAFDDINIDVVYGLPRQTEASFATTIDTVIDLAPDRVAMFGYAHLPSKLPHQRIVERAGRILDPYERATLLVMAIEKFARAGYVHIGLDHFAKPGSRLAVAAAEKRLVRTFQGYVEQQADTILGVGTSSISSTPRLYWQNHPDLAPWQEAIGAQQLPVHRGCVLDHDDRTRRAFIGALMCDGEVDLAAFGDAHGIDAERYFAKELGELGSISELASFDPARHRVATTEIGRLLVRNVCMKFDRYLGGAVGAQRFSTTI